jgi:hypothetical protein
MSLSPTKGLDEEPSNEQDFVSFELAYSRNQKLSLSGSTYALLFDIHAVDQDRKCAQRVAQLSEAERFLAVIVLAAESMCLF